MEILDYKNYEGLIKKIAFSWSQTTGIDSDEFISEANEEFVLSSGRFDETRGVKFSTYLYKNVNLRCKTLWIKRMKNSNRFVCVDEKTSGTETIEKQIRVKEWSKTLSKESQFIIGIIFETPRAIIDLSLKNNKPKLTKKLIQEYLRSVGWNWKDIRSSFKEIDSNLYNI